MPSESTILEVRADEIKVGDEMYDSPFHGWRRVEEAHPRTPNAVNLKIGGGWVSLLGSSPVIVRRPAPSPSTAGAEVERIARAFHESYERQAPAHGYETREASAVPWEKVPTANRQLMRATVSDLLARGVIAPAPSPSETAEGEQITAVEYLRRQGVTPAEGESLDDAFRRLGAATPNNSKSGQTLGDEGETP